MRNLLSFILLISFLLLLNACGGGSDSADNTDTPNPVAFSLALSGITVKEVGTNRIITVDNSGIVSDSLTFE